MTELLAFITGTSIPEIIILVFFILLVWAVIDVIRRNDLPGMNKTIWLIALLIFSMAAPLVYLIVKQCQRKCFTTVD